MQRFCFASSFGEMNRMRSYAHNSLTQHTHSTHTHRCYTLAGYSQDTHAHVRLFSNYICFAFLVRLVFHFFYPFYFLLLSLLLLFAIARVYLCVFVCICLDDTKLEFSMQISRWGSKCMTERSPPSLSVFQLIFSLQIELLPVRGHNQLASSSIFIYICSIFRLRLMVPTCLWK